MNLTSRADFENLIGARMREAQALLAVKEWDGAFYLAGYAVECAFKVRIIVELMESDTYPDRKLSEKFYQHDLAALCKLAGLEDEIKSDPAVNFQWGIVKDWSEQSRYELGKTEAQVVELYGAIEREVLPWIKARW